MSQTCSCGATVPDNSKFCPVCGKSQVGQVNLEGPAANPGSLTAPASGMTQNVAAGLSYITFIPAIIFLVVEPYNKNSFVRFHAWQCIFLSTVSIAFSFVTNGMWMFGGFGLGSLIWLLQTVVNIGLFVLWLIAMISAFQDKIFKIPLVGDWAEKQAGAR